MIDWAQEIAHERVMQAKQAAATETGFVITIRASRTHPSCGPTLRIETNHPALLVFEDETGELGYELSGGLVHSLTGSCPCNMTSIEELAQQGVTEIRGGGEDGGLELVIPIPPYTPPSA